MRKGTLTLMMVLALAGTVNAGTLLFDVNPLANNPVLTQPGRQIVNGAGGGPIFNFDPATDTIAFSAGAFNVPSVQFVTGDTTGFPASGITVAVVTNAGAAGQAANLLAAQITDPGAGFFLYFNTGLDVPRLVFSTDLSDAGADLAILAQFTNLAGQNAVLGSITAANFQAIPEPSSMLLLGGSALAGACYSAVRRRRQSA